MVSQSASDRMEAGSLLRITHQKLVYLVDKLCPHPRQFKETNGGVRDTRITFSRLGSVLYCEAHLVAQSVGDLIVRPEDMTICAIAILFVRGRSVTRSVSSRDRRPMMPTIPRDTEMPSVPVKLQDQNKPAL